MKTVKSGKNKNFLKKLFIKICRKFGYEIIDQNDLYLPASNIYCEFAEYHRFDKKSFWGYDI